MVVVFMALYGPRLKLLDLATFANFGFALMFIFGVRCGGLTRTVLVTGLFFLAVAAAFVVQQLMIGAEDKTAALVMIKYGMYVMSSAMLSYLFWVKYQKYCFLHVIRYVAIATAINSMFVVLFFSVPPVSIVATMFLDYEEQSGWVDLGHRAFDISIGGGAVASFVFASVLFLYWIVATQLVLKKAEVFIVSAAILLGVLITGRTGIFILALQLLFYAVFSVRPVSFRTIVSGIVYLAIIGLLIFSVRGVVPAIDLWFEWYFEWLNNYLQYGSFSSGSTDAIKEMYFFPDDMMSLMIGEANFGRTPGMPYIPSDVGYVRAVFGVGLVGALLLFGVYLCPLFWGGLNTIPYNFRIAMGLFVAGYFVFNFKEMYLAGRAGSQLFFLATLSLFISYRDYPLADTAGENHARS